VIQTLYIEEEVSEHPRTREICSRFPSAARISITRYGEIFNRKGQNFRLQKKRPALILARKYGHFVLPAPDSYGVGGRRNFYFSHMLNCIYDCRYCFLQGMYRSAHYVLFVNYEDFQRAIESKLREAPEKDSYFFSGYDCDSLALERVTRFVESFYPFFAEHSNAWLELRTKSSQVKSLLAVEPLPNCIVAFSLTPEPTGHALEHEVPPLDQRLDAMKTLEERGWHIGLRFDPMIFTEDYHLQYRRLFAEVFEKLRADRLHSVSLGPFRLPRPYFEEVSRLYPDERLFAGPLVARGRMVSYRKEMEQEMMDFCTRELLPYIAEEIFFPAETIEAVAR
jgi:spore photoproduct lyase